MNVVLCTSVLKDNKIGILNLIRFEYMSNSKRVEIKRITSDLKGGYLDISHLIELKNI